MCRRHFRTLVMPSAPFVHNKFDTMVLVDLTHGGPMVFNEVFHAAGFFEQLVPVIDRKIDSLSFSGSAAIVMHRPAIHPAEQSFVALGQPLEEAPRPFQVAATWAGGD